MTTTDRAHGTKATEDNKPYPLHAIQLADLRVVEVSLRANMDVAKSDPPGTFELTTGHGVYDAEHKRIQVKVAATMGHQDDGKSPFALKVELVGMFIADTSRFPEEHITQWARTNAPMVLYPYLREQVYGLALRAGYTATLLPLLEIPTFRLMPQADGTVRVVTSRAGSND
ncbi:hypothetical protein WK80_29850 [Burkholderia multivorans]|uniref:protein-export chaperone SecB n=1 Tax=Burkholderia multivorans TaxID=87883 RepID=UPI0007526153|nr:protein-export chaperone SecB [Burkholderia multivorans]KVV17369.1 hypothetical protein WK80_29850 [Burkholderia multivorans]MBU9203529.1 protein-export chaperone SecB [Burkholderia multivorans]MCA8386565.1 protein-export chaperone SecB [Burkholderia multivorans]MCO8320251.1 protein-export chaperone SecB [Burkholderia multivorans]MCO8354328.1 protein-export chaperone SecB [Burkholderia multivorans]